MKKSSKLNSLREDITKGLEVKIDFEVLEVHVRIRTPAYAMRILSLINKSRREVMAS